MEMSLKQMVKKQKAKTQRFTALRLRVCFNNMKQFKLTLLVSTDYCQINPSDPKCQLIERVTANNKTEAINIMHQNRGMMYEISTKTTKPQVWSIEEV